MSKKILIVEDETPMREALAAKLSTTGFETLQAENGERGLELAVEEKPDMILLDILMPKMDGMVMMEKVRATEWGKTVPIIFLTNLGEDSKVLQKLIQHNDAYYFVKANTKLSKLIDKINEIFGA